MNSVQTGAVFLKTATINLEFPSADSEVISGICWGAIEAFPTPAYWAYQVYSKRITGNHINYKLGSTLKEEVGACLLGGHGIPAKIGLAAYKHIKNRGAFEGNPPSEVQLFQWLSEPIKNENKLVYYRFARQKAKYLSHALQKLSTEEPPLESGKLLRNWLISINGIGYKTASWITRNWLDADDVAILDIHILRAGILGGFFNKELTIERHYLELEKQFIEFSTGLGVRASELDAIIWLEMMASPATVHQLFNKTKDSIKVTSKQRLRASKSSHSYTNQLTVSI